MVKDSWNHLMCDRCWNREHPESEPNRVVGDRLDWCCFCGEMTDSGIYVRRDPKIVHQEQDNG